MTPRTTLTRFGALALVLATLVASHPAIAAAPATFGGRVVADADLGAAKIELATRTGEIVASGPVAVDGAFTLENVPAGTYRVAVTTPAGAYGVRSTVTLAPGARQDVQIAVQQEGTGGGAGSDGFFSTPWGKFVGVALIVGGAGLAAWAINDSDSDAAPDQAPSPSEPEDELGK